MGAPASPIDAAVAASWTLECPSISCSSSIWAGTRRGPVRVISVANRMGRQYRPSRPRARSDPM